MDLPDNIHQKRTYPDGKMIFRGRVGGYDYEIHMDAAAHTVIWVGGELAARAAEEPDSKLARLLSLAKDAATGAAGIAQARLGLNVVSEEDYNTRRTICLACPEYNGFGVCNECGCYLDARIRLKRKACPLDKWAAITVGKS